MFTLTLLCFLLSTFGFNAAIKKSSVILTENHVAEHCYISLHPEQQEMVTLGLRVIII